MRVLMILVAFLLSAAAMAYQPEDKQPNIADILENQATIRSEAEARVGVFKAMPARQRNDLVTKSSLLSNTLEGKQWADLTDAQRIEVFNTLEQINAALTKAEDERVVCEQKKRPGSNMIMKSCKTVAQLREQREDSQKFLEENGICKGHLNCVPGQ